MQYKEAGEWCILDQVDGVFVPKDLRLYRYKRRQCLSTYYQDLVFKGPVAWTGKKTGLDRTATEKDRFVSNWLQPVTTGL